jgi:hypothetical protein
LSKPAESKAGLFGGDKSEAGASLFVNAKKPGDGASLFGNDKKEGGSLFGAEKKETGIFGKKPEE